MTILSWLFGNKNNNNNNQHHQQHQQQVEINEEIEEEQEEENEDYNYFNTSYFNNGYNSNIGHNLFNHLITKFNDNQLNEIVISFDTTGKMFNYFTEFKNQIDSVLGMVFGKLPNLKISIICHGDYCDDSRVTGNTISILPFTNNINEIKQFTNTTHKTNGGDAPECYEYVMRKVRELPWSTHSKKTLIMIGDDVPHPPSFTNQHYYWRNELHYLTKIGVKVYGIQCENNSHAKLFYEELATLSTGRYLHLTNPMDTAILCAMISFKESANGKSFLLDNLTDISSLSSVIGSGNGNSKKQLKCKFHQLFSNEFIRERDSSVNIRFPWWDISFDVSPNCRFIWDDDSKSFIENVISVQNECSSGIPISLVSQFNIEKSKSTSVTPSSSIGNLSKLSQNSPVAADGSISNTGSLSYSPFPKSFSTSSFLNNLNSSGTSTIDLDTTSGSSTAVIKPTSTQINATSSSTLYQENNFIKTIAKPQHPFTLFYQNSSLINTPFINNSNINDSTQSFSKAGMSITIDKSHTTSQNTQLQQSQQPQTQQIESASKKRKLDEKNQDVDKTGTPKSDSRYLVNGSTIGGTEKMNLIEEFIKEQLNSDNNNKATTSTTTPTKQQQPHIFVNNSSSPSLTSSSSSTTTTTYNHKDDLMSPKKYHKNEYSASIHGNNTNNNSSPQKQQQQIIENDHQLSQTSDGSHFLDLFDSQAFPKSITQTTTTTTTTTTTINNSA